MKGSSFIRKADRDYIISIKECLYCGNTQNLHIDHIHPRELGGNGIRENLTRACQRCNSLKQAFIIPVFTERMFSKRNDEYWKTRKYLNRLRTDIKRHREGSDHRNWLIDKVEAGRKEHTYFTKVIHSLINKKYIPNGKRPSSIILYK